MGYEPDAKTRKAIDDLVSGMGGDVDYVTDDMIDRHLVGNPEIANWYKAYFENAKADRAASQSGQSTPSGEIPEDSIEVTDDAKDFARRWLLGSTQPPTSSPITPADTTSAPASPADTTPSNEPAYSHREKFKTEMELHKALFGSSGDFNTIRSTDPKVPQSRKDEAYENIRNNLTSLSDEEIEIILSEDLIESLSERHRLSGNEISWLRSELEGLHVSDKNIEEKVELTPAGIDAYRKLR